MDTDTRTVDQPGGLHALPALLTADLAPLVDLLSDWHREYFATVDPAILSGLRQEAEARRLAVVAADPAQAVESATGGMFPEPLAESQRIVLVPQYHFRPWNLYSAPRGLRLYRYPADVLPPAPGEPAPALLRLTRALSDENRLRILRLVARVPRSFSDIVQETGLAKSTVHHHLVALRAAGLIRAHDTRGRLDRYSLRPGCWNLVSQELANYLNGEA